MFIRIEFARKREMMFTSHLDTLRTFGRALRRAAIPVRYSTGFNPRAQLVFGLPLQVGMVGLAEYLDVELASDAMPDEMLNGLNARLPNGLIAGHNERLFNDLMNGLNAQLPAGLVVTDARVRRVNENIMSQITHAEYTMRIAFGNDREASGAYSGLRDGEELRDGKELGDEDELRTALREAVELFKLPGARMAEKTARKPPDGRRGKKNGIKSVDIAPFIIKIEAHGDVLEVIARAGSSDNVRPELLLDALNNLYRSSPISEGRPEKFIIVSSYRKALYIERGGVLYKPIESAVCG